jgi:Tfp pilus assembly protein PilE
MTRMTHTTHTTHTTREARRTGLTNVELIIAIVLIGVVMAIAIPAIARSTARGNVAPVKADLANLVKAQEGYFYQHSSYAADPAALGVTLSPGVTATIVEATPTGWSATAAHPTPVPVTCALFYGSAKPVAPATEAGQVACR